MEKKKTFIEVQQKVRDMETKQAEAFKHQTEAVWYELSTFSKIVYQDAQNQTVEVKWMPNQSHLEIKYGQNRFIFDINHSTSMLYATAQGQIPLVVVTKQLTIRQNRLSVTYQLLSGEEVMGQYEFQLIYRR
ncbi:DUF1934 family protein [Aerococcaceae bacterium zg-ZJ1578]|uniref:DUF1934 family protein n=1 Tax=Aerococcaceae bacterium zg-252 TaxID=2796928 RepID=UPI001A26E97B|nr:DUF1934 family protein [Aerococcaceae bacterium zg-1578]